MPDRDKEAIAFVAELLRMLIDLRIEVEALKSLVLFQSNLQYEQFETIRAKVQERWKPALDILERGDAEKTLDILRNFEGPVQ